MVHKKTLNPSFSAVAVYDSEREAPLAGWKTVLDLLGDYDNKGFPLRDIFENMANNDSYKNKARELVAFASGEHPSGLSISIIKAAGGKGAKPVDMVVVYDAYRDQKLVVAPKRLSPADAEKLKFETGVTFVNSKAKNANEQAMEFLDFSIRLRKPNGAYDRPGFPVAPDRTQDLIEDLIKSTAIIADITPLLKDGAIWPKDVNAAAPLIAIANGTMEAAAYSLAEKKPKNAARLKPGNL